MVEIDSEGKLRWTHNQALVDTTPGRWKDASGGSGIVPMTAAEKAGKVTRSDQRPSGERENPQHYLDRQISGNLVTRSLKTNFTRKGIMLKLLRKTVKADTWIYVSVSAVLAMLGGLTDSHPRIKTVRLIPISKPIYPNQHTQQSICLLVSKAREYYLPEPSC